MPKTIADLIAELVERHRSSDDGFRQARFDENVGKGKMCPVCYGNGFTWGREWCPQCDGKGHVPVVNLEEAIEAVQLVANEEGAYAVVGEMMMHPRKALDVMLLRPATDEEWEQALKHWVAEQKP